MVLRGARVPKILGERRIVLSLLGLALFATTLQFVPMTSAQSVSAFCLLQGDCDPPTQPQLVLPDDGAFRQSNDFMFSWQQVSDESAVSYTVCTSKYENFSMRTCADGITATEAGAEGLIPAASDGQWYWRVIAEDEVGNRSDWSQARLVGVDTIDPTVTLESDRYEIGGTAATAHLKGSVTDENLVAYELLVIDPEGTVVLTTESPASLKLDWDATNLPSGMYVVQLSAHDKSGRVTAISKQIAVDNNGPSITMPDGFLITEPYIKPAATVSDAHQNNLLYEWVADEDNPGFFDFNAGVLNPDFQPVLEGSYTFYLTVTDDFGNRSAASFSFDYKKELEQLPPPDTTNPVATQSNDQDAPSLTPPAPQPIVVSRSADSETGSNGENVLGDTVQRLLSGNDTIDSPAVIAATPGGWRILGILWYWWLLVGMALIVAALAIRRRLMRRQSSSVS